MTLKEDIAAMHLRIARAESERDRWYKQLEWEPVEVHWFDRQDVEGSPFRRGLEIVFPAAAAVFKSDPTRRYFLADKESAAKEMVKAAFLSAVRFGFPSGFSTSSSVIPCEKDHGWKRPHLS